jgi:hypothetical protein
MEQGFIDILKQLAKEQGNAALTDVKKCKPLLADYTKNEYKKESSWLVQAVETGIAKAIDGADELAACKKAKIRDLEEEKGLSPAVAADIVDTLALVLRGDKTKTAIEKPSAEKATVEKASSKKAATNKPSEKKATTGKIADTPGADIKYRNLFDAYTQGKLPFSGGYIISSFVSETNAYSIYEIVSYANAKEIFLTEDGLRFVTAGEKLYILVENDTYDKKLIEPASRPQGESIPRSFDQMETIIAKNKTKIMVAKEALASYGSFEILKPKGINFSVVFDHLPAVYASLAVFFEVSLSRMQKVPESDSKKAAQLIVRRLKEQ